jgi:hypothetical protein
MKLRLFAIRDLSTGRILPQEYFASKSEAKARRDELGSASYCVTYGPDHRHFNA